MRKGYGIVDHNGYMPPVKGYIDQKMTEDV